jgi:predicted enzyme related to lactoylglutathione lyase
MRALRQQLGEIAMARPVHFEISALNPERVANFYREVFDWQITKWNGPNEYWVVVTGKRGPGIDGGLLRREAWNRGTVNTIDVASIEDALERIVASGGRISDPMAIPGVGWLAYCEDPEGNRFGVLQADPHAS